MSARDGIELTLSWSEAKFLHSLLGNHVFGQGEARLTNFGIWHALNAALGTECAPLPVEAGRGQVWVKDNGA